MTAGNQRTEESDMVDTAENVAEDVKEKAGDAVDDAQEATSDGNGSLAKRLLLPAAAGARTLAATYAASKAPDFFRECVKPKLEQEGGKGAAKMGKQAAEKLKGEGGMVGGLAKATEKLGAAAAAAAAATARRRGVSRFNVGRTSRRPSTRRTRSGPSSRSFRTSCTES